VDKEEGDGDEIAAGDVKGDEEVTRVFEWC
jgi:hypothetical protein